MRMVRAGDHDRLAPVLELPAILDTAAAAALRSALLARVAGGAPIVVDGSAVVQIGLASFQVLLSAATTAAAAGVDFRLVSPSTLLSEMAEMAGFGDLLDRCD